LTCENAGLLAQIWFTAGVIIVNHDTVVTQRDLLIGAEHEGTMGRPLASRSSRAGSGNVRSEVWEVGLLVTHGATPRDEAASARPPPRLLWSGMPATRSVSRASEVRAPLPRRRVVALPSGDGKALRVRQPDSTSAARRVTNGPRRQRYPAM
jgi:hypothetical protein